MVWFGFIGFVNHKSIPQTKSPLNLIGLVRVRSILSKNPNQLNWFGLDYEDDPNR